MKNSTVIAVIIFSMVAGCSKEEVTPRNFPRVNTIEATNITSGGATFKAEITFASVPMLDHGFLWSDYALPLFNNSDKISLGSKTGTGAFEAICDRTLQEGKTYYLRAYAISEDHTVFGKIVKFVSLGSKAPVIKDFYPALGTWGDTITIVGENFSTVLNSTGVKFNEFPATVLRATKDTLKVNVPFELTEEFSSITITQIGNVATPTKKYQLRGPVIESASPQSGTTNTLVSITVKFLGINAKIYFNNILATNVSVSGNSIVCKVPANLPAGEVELKVETGTGTLFDTAPFEIRGPQLLQVSPSVGGEGDEIKLIGDFFSTAIEANEVMFENALATVVASSKTELRLIVPPHVNSINPSISVSISGLKASSGGLFSFSPPVIESFTPSGGIGSVITIKGKYFRSGGYHRVFIGDHELSNVYGYSSTEIQGYLDGVSREHSQKIKVTFQEQEAYSVEEFKMPWISLDDYPDPDNSPATSLIYNNKAFMGFGYSQYNHFWKFDPATRAWDQLGDFPGTRRQSFSFTAGTKGYVGGGTDSPVTARDLWEYDFANDSWSKKSDLPMTGVIRVAVSLPNTGYILELDPVSTKLWKYNQAADAWTIESTAPFLLGEDRGYFLIANTLYLVVGYNLWKYDASTTQWTDLGPTPETISHSFSIGNFGYGVSYSQMFKYDPNLNTWATEPSPIQYYGSPSEVFSVAGKGFVIISNSILEFDPSF